MTSNRTKKAMVGAAAAAVVSIGTLGGFAAAESVGGPTTTAPPTAPTTTVAPNASDPKATHPDRAARWARNQSDLAAALGVSVDQLHAAEKKVLFDRVDARLDQAVANDRITRQRADEIEQALKDGDVSKLPPRLRDRAKRVLQRLGG
jgi:hypothetical protein